MSDTRITTINSIEVSSRCDNRCPYCPVPMQHKHRDTGLMDWDTFQAAIDWVRTFSRRGTQRELNLFGCGEPTLNPRLVDMVALARMSLRVGQKLHLNTNGNRMTLDLARTLKSAGIDSIDITGHDAWTAANAVRVLKQAGIAHRVSFDFILAPNNWAGQVHWLAPDYSYPCQWLSAGQVMVMSNGDVTACCLDAFGRGVFATILGDLDAAGPRPFITCATCHHVVPAELRHLVPKE